MFTVKGESLTLATVHPTAQEVAVDDIRELVAQGIRTTPHVGNLDRVRDSNLEEQAVFVGAHNAGGSSIRSYVALALMGVRVECVDTISADDDEGYPCTILQSEQQASLVSVPGDYRRTHVPAAVIAEGSDKSLEDIHMDALRAVADRSTTRTELYDSLGTQHGYSRGEIYRSLMLAVDGPVRLARDGRVSRDPQARAHSSTVEQHGLFGNGTEPLDGLLPPLTMAMAAELVQAAIEGNTELHHIGGVDMPGYTREPELMTNVASIAERAMIDLGIQVPRFLTYRVYNKYTGIAGLPELSRQISNAIGLSYYTQHDLHACPELLERAKSLAR